MVSLWRAALLRDAVCLLGSNMHDITSVDMEMRADLIHGLLGSMGQLCKAFPTLWDQGIHAHTRTHQFTIVCVG